MNTDFQWNLQQVADGISRGVLEERAKRSFLYPHDNIWPKETSQFVAIADTIYENLNNNQKKWFLSVCLASFLLNQKKSPQIKSWFLSKTSINEVLGLELTWDEIITWNWGRIAIPGADQAEGWNDRIIYALVAVSKSASSSLLLPTWCDRCLNNVSLEAVQTAAELVVSRNSNAAMLFWPQLDPANPNIVINGASLGLPVYLSFCSLAANKPIPSILATGKVDNNGILHEVAGLEEKFRLAHKKGFSSFLYPLLPGVRPLDASGKVNAIGAQDLEQACSIWISQKPAESNNVVNVWMTTALDKIGDQLSEVKRTLSQSRILIVVGTIILILLLGVFFNSIKQSTNTNRTVIPSNQPIKDSGGHTVEPKQSGQTSLPPERSTPSVKEHETNAGVQQAKGAPHNSLSRNQTEVAVKVFKDLNEAIDNRMLTEHDDNASTPSCFRIAKELMVNGRPITARKKYEECFSQNSRYLDTLIDYQKLLKGLEGIEGAKSSFSRLQQQQANISITFASLLLDTSKKRYESISKFVKSRPDFAPAYYWLGMDCYEYYEKDSGCSDILGKFVKLSNARMSDSYFVNRSVLNTMIAEAQEKMIGGGQ